MGNNKTMEEQKKVRRAVYFTNVSDEDFYHTWDSVTYKFPAGKTQLLEDYLAYHFAKHLAYRELNKKDEKVQYMEKDKKFQDFIKECVSLDDAEEAEDETQLTQKILNKEASNKGVTKKEIKEEVKEFEDLKNGTTKSKKSK